MGLREDKIGDWDAFLELLGTLGVSAGDRRYLYRGQADAEWDLKPSLLRLLPDNLDPVSARQLESAAEHKFAAHMQRYIDAWELPPQGQPTLTELWMLMRQYGAPTRLLDWTWSPYVALYIAASENSDKDGAFWYYDHEGLVKAVQKAYKQINIAEIAERAVKSDWVREEPRMLNLFPRMRISERIFRQQCVFTVCDNIFMEHAEGLKLLDSATSAGIKLTKAIIKKSVKQLFLKNLEAMNITAASLFPGIEGLARTATDIVIQNRPELAADETKEMKDYQWVNAYGETGRFQGLSGEVEGHAT